MARLGSTPLPPRSGSVLLVLLLLPACAAGRSGYPSLAPRAIEHTAGEPAATPIAPEAPVDPALTARLAAIRADAHAADARFRSGLAEVQRLAAAAGAPGSESWVAAQQALSALGVTRSEGIAALGELDQRADAIVSSSAPSPQALDAIGATRTEVASLDAAHGAALDTLAQRLSPPS